jgi:hypothetical protein
VHTNAVCAATVDQALDVFRDRVKGEAKEGENKEKGPERHESWQRGRTLT